MKIPPPIFVPCFPPLYRFCCPESGSPLSSLASSVYWPGSVMKSCSVRCDVAATSYAFVRFQTDAFDVAGGNGVSSSLKGLESVTSTVCGIAWRLSMMSDPDRGVFAVQRQPVRRANPALVSVQNDRRFSDRAVMPPERRPLILDWFWCDASTVS